jgi:hypothetical protein
MKSRALTSRNIEAVVYGILWLFVFSVPFFRTREFSILQWDRIIREWVHLSAFLFIFLINIYFLVPRLLFRKRYLLYCIGTFSVILLVVGTMQASEAGIVPRSDTSISPSTIGPDAGIPLQQNKPPHMVLIDNMIIAILVIGAGTASKLVTKWLEEEKLRKDIEKEQLKTNLALLRHQVSPHFFMNTLNNIHALIDINTENAKDAIVRLSTLMRYLLYDSAQGTIALKKEIEFINSFVSLMQLRYSDQVDIQVKMPEQIPDVHIPPMLFVSFLENAFKHGISYQSKSFIHFELKIQPNSLLCSIKNSKHDIRTSQDDEYMGIGLENIKKSLQLLFNESYSLNIADNQNSFEVGLTIPL